MLFILGNARSGTTLLQVLLDAHPEIVGSPESKFAVLFYPRYKHIKKWKESDIIDFVEHLYKEPLFVQLWHLDKEKLKKELLKVKENATYSLLCKMVYYQMRNGKNNPLYLSDKNPEYTLYIDTILKMFPEAKFIHIIREPRDTIYSQMISFKEKNSKFKAFKWLAFNTIVEGKKKKDPERYFTLLYENLVNDTEATMKDLSSFLNIPFSASMAQNKSPEWLNAHLEKNVLTENAKPFYANLLKPINPSKIGNWKNHMDVYDQTLAEIITGDFAHKMYGYEIDSNHKNKPVKISAYSLFKGNCLYFFWQMFKQVKVKSTRLNLLYARFRIMLNPNVRISKFF